MESSYRTFAAVLHVELTYNMLLFYPKNGKLGFELYDTRSDAICPIINILLMSSTLSADGFSKHLCKAICASMIEYLLTKFVN